MATLYCDQCGKESKFLPIYTTLKLVGVSRSTIYYWMERQWVHWRLLPSGRRVICQESLSRDSRQVAPAPAPDAVTSDVPTT